MNKKAIIILSTLGLLAIAHSCLTSNENQQQTVTPVSMIQTDLSNGFNLLDKNCFSCHSPKGAHDARIAPPMVAIKKHYIDEKTSLDAFSEDLISFVQNPIEENSKMPGAISKFGVMPKMEFSEKELRDITAYIYETKLEEPEWFEQHYQQEQKRYRKGQQQGEFNYLEMGKEMAMQTKSQLGSNLMAAVKERGPEGAVEFCNTRAYPLTDSMAIVLGANIKRVSDQPRNPENSASEAELNYIRNAKAQLMKGEGVTPLLTDLGKTMVGYYPITTNVMCLKCHGEPKTQINQPTLDVLNALYPDDKAKGYGENELRGIWVVEMNKTTPKTKQNVKSKRQRTQ
ncbi:MAG: cytochrome c553 [Cryomorphaceae bacterium]|jgi:cytochrome c553